MRLLQLDDDGRLRLCHFPNNNIPPFAILSHTWGSDDEEVNFQDVQKPTSWDKEGYQKILFCGQQAKRDGLDYFWVDTCCIDKSSSSELQEAITSMFRWYHDSSRCYVYLSDVAAPSLDGDKDQSTWELEFRISRWFTRGWTLQELIAPPFVEFYSQEEQLLGSKETLAELIRDITGISPAILRGRPIDRISVEERFSWTTNRQTTRDEDLAYCLLGIFDVGMSIRYGEGHAEALARLHKKIQKKLHRTGAIEGEQRVRWYTVYPEDLYQWLRPQDTSTNYHKASARRSPDTGLWFLEGEQFVEWKRENTSVLWLSGIAGVGKTTLAAASIEAIRSHCLQQPTRAFAYFFFDYKDAQKQSVELMLRSLLVQLAEQSSAAFTGVRQMYRSCSNGLQEPSKTVLQHGIRTVIENLADTYIVLDALDECLIRSELLDAIQDMLHWRCEGLHLLLTSRKERDIETSLCNVIEHYNIIDLRSHLVDEDIRHYVRHRLSEDLNLQKWARDPDLRNEIEGALVSGAQGMFRWVSCQLDALGSCRNRAMLREALKTLPRSLDETYGRILKSIHDNDSKYAIRILRCLAFGLRPLTLEEVVALVAIDVNRTPAFDPEELLEDPFDILSICSSLVTLRLPDESGSRIVELAHYSVKEYLTSGRLTDPKTIPYSLTTAESHAILSQTCLLYLLRWNEMTLGFDRVVEPTDYPAKFWAIHLLRSKEERLVASLLAVVLLTPYTEAFDRWCVLSGCDTETLEYCSVDPTVFPLSYATHLGLIKVVELLVERGDSINVVVRGFYHQGSDFCKLRRRHSDLLYIATAHNYVDMVILLIQKGICKSYYPRCLELAGVYNLGEIARLLLQGGNTCISPEDKTRALQAAACRGSWNVVRELLKVETDILLRDDRYFVTNVDPDLVDQCYFQVTLWADYTNLSRMLKKEGASLEALKRFHSNLLYMASLHGKLDIVVWLIGHNVDINVQGGKHGSAIEAAARGGHTHIIDVLRPRAPRMQVGPGNR